jgi:hypothetical protein
VSEDDGTLSAWVCGLERERERGVPGYMVVMGVAGVGEGGGAAVGVGGVMCRSEKGARSMVGAGVWVSECDKAMIIWSAWTGVALREGDMVGAGGGWSG